MNSVNFGKNIKGLDKELGRMLPESGFVRYKDVKEYLMMRFEAAGLI